ncbi:MAG: flavoprotein [Candidatus Bathyarchaeia archaeon]
MVVRIAWGITGAGHFLKESFHVFEGLARSPGTLVTTFLTKAGVEVVKSYGLWDALRRVSPGGYYQEVFTDEDQGACAFKAGRLYRAMYHALVVSPATANTVAKIVHGIADSLVANAVAEAQRGSVPVFIVPTDFEMGLVETVFPTPEHAGTTVQAKVRPLDARNVKLLQEMDGITVLRRPAEIEVALRPILTVRPGDSTA